MAAPPSSNDTLPTSPATTTPSQETPAPSSTETSCLTTLANKKVILQQKLAALRAQRAEAVSKATLPSGLAMPEDWSEEQKSKQAIATANGVIKEHIQLLHRYNEIKDIGLGLMGMVAEKRGVKQAVVMEDFGVGEKD